MSVALPFRPASELLAPRPRGERGRPLGDPSGPFAVIGGADPLAGGVAPSPSALFGPRGACLLGPEGPLVVCDTGHHRLLVWSRLPTRDDQPADHVIGQPSFFAEGRNGGDRPGPATLNVPTGVSRVGSGFAVADGWNHRVLLWHRPPERDGQPADVVLGQADFAGVHPNRDPSPRGLPRPGPDTLNLPFQVMEHAGRLVVADTGNRRILIWDRIPTEHGTPADHVLGQDGFVDRAPDDVGPRRFRWPHDLAVVRGDLVVTDAGNNRVLVFDGIPWSNGVAARAVLGQPDSFAVDPDRGADGPDARSLSLPYAVAAWGDLLVVADTANSRLLGFPPPFEAGMDTAATHLAGQRHFGRTGDNRWQPPVRDSLCWPYGLDAVPGLLVVADTGNHRILLWGRAGGARG